MSNNKNKNNGADLQQDADGAQNGAKNQQGADGAKNSNQNADKAKAKKSKFAEKAERIFKQYPVSKELHFTSDGTAFFNKIDAANYASGLGKKEVETVTAP